MMRLKSKLLSLNAGKADKDKTKVYSPRNCEELRIPFKTDKIAKVVGKLATETPPTELFNQQQQRQAPGASGPILSGVLVQNDFKLSLMAPEDLQEYAGLTTTTIVCRQRLTLSAAGIDLIRWALEGTFGAIEELPEMHKKKNKRPNGKSMTKNGTNGTAANGDTGDEAMQDSVGGDGSEKAEKNGDEDMEEDPEDDEEQEEEEEEADEEVNKLVAAYLVMGCVSVRYYANGEIELEWEGNLLNDGIADAVMAVLFSVESSPAAVKRKFWSPMFSRAVKH